MPEALQSILIVDDDPGQLGAVIRGLEADGYRLRVCRERELHPHPRRQIVLQLFSSKQHFSKMIRLDSIASSLFSGLFAISKSIDINAFLSSLSLRAASHRLLPSPISRTLMSCGPVCVPYTHSPASRL